MKNDFGSSKTLCKLRAQVHYAGKFTQKHVSRVMHALPAAFVLCSVLHALFLFLKVFELMEKVHYGLWFVIR